MQVAKCCERWTKEPGARRAGELLLGAKGSPSAVTSALGPQGQKGISGKKPGRFPAGGNRMVKASSGNCLGQPRSGQGRAAAAGQTGRAEPHPAGVMAAGKSGFCLRATGTTGGF